MSTVRKMTKSTLSLLALIVCIILISQIIRYAFSDYYFTMNQLLYTNRLVGGIYKIAGSVLFVFLLVVSGIEVIMSEKQAQFIFEPYRAPLVFISVFILWGMMGSFSLQSVLWFRLIYLIGLIICYVISFGRIAKLPGGGSGKISEFLKDPLPDRDLSINMIDRRILLWVKRIILLLEVVLVFLLVAYCIQYGSNLIHS